MDTAVGPPSAERPSIMPETAFPAWLLAWLAVNIAGAAVVAGTTDVDADPAIAVLLGVQLIGAVVYGAALVFASVGSHWRRAPGVDPVVLPPGGPLAKLRRDYRVGFRPVDLVAIPLGVVAQLVLVPAVYLPLRAIWKDTFDDEALTETAENLVDRAGGATIVLLVISVCVLAPLIEEFVYRGLLQGALTNRWSRPLAVVAIAALFSLIHFRPVEFPGLFVAGLVFGACFAVTDRLATAILCHLAFNVAGLLLVL